MLTMERAKLLLPPVQVFQGLSTADQGPSIAARLGLAACAGQRLTATHFHQLGQLAMAIEAAGITFDEVRVMTAVWLSDL